MRPAGVCNVAVIIAPPVRIMGNLPRGLLATRCVYDARCLEKCGEGAGRVVLLPAGLPFPGQSLGLRALVSAGTGLENFLVPRSKAMAMGMHGP